MAERVRITDVSPRDGLQNETRPVPTSEKLRLVRALCTARVDEVEVSSFVSARWIPQLGDAAELFAMLAADPQLRDRRPAFSALVPNEQGVLAALEVNRLAGRRLLDKLSVFTAASETFSRRNTNASISASIERFRPVVAAAQREGLAVRAYISCAIACPFEGPTPPSRVAEVIEMLAGLTGHGRVDEIDLGDTIGAGTPRNVRPMLEAAIQQAARSLPGAGLTLHLHDTFGAAGACVATALDMGIRSFDASAGGLGGCPYAGTPGRRAPGNISTELLVETVRRAGFEVGVDDAALAGAAQLARSLTAAP